MRSFRPTITSSVVGSVVRTRAVSRPLGAAEYAPFRFVCTNQAGNVVLTGFDPQITYAVSLAALDVNGRVSGFSAEVLVGPPQ